MQQHPVTRHVFEPQRYSGSVVLKLHNPVLPALHQQGKPDFWLESAADETKTLKMERRVENS